MNCVMTSHSIVIEVTQGTLHCVEPKFSYRIRECLLDHGIVHDCFGFANSMNVVPFTVNRSMDAPPPMGG